MYALDCLPYLRSATTGTSPTRAPLLQRLHRRHGREELTVEDCPSAGADDCPRDCTAMEGQGYLECCGGVRLGGVVLVSWAMLINLTHIISSDGGRPDRPHLSIYISPTSPRHLPISPYITPGGRPARSPSTRLRLSLPSLALGQLITLFMILIHWDGWFLVLCIGEAWRSRPHLLRHLHDLLRAAAQARD